jgi:hypothetical protein
MGGNRGAGAIFSAASGTAPKHGVVHGKIRPLGAEFGLMEQSLRNPKFETNPNQEIQMNQTGQA